MMKTIPPLAALILALSLTATSRAADPARLSRLKDSLDRSEFVAFTAEDVVASRAALLGGLAQAPTGLAADDWQYLKTGDVAKAVETNSDDLDEYLENLIAKLSQDTSPFENPGLIGLRRVARHYRVVLENRRETDQLRAAFVRAKATISDALGRFGAGGSASEFERLADEIRWFDRKEQATDFVREARTLLSFPNLELRLPANLVRAATQQELPIQTEAIDRNSDGIQTSGTMEVRGRYYLEPIPAVGGAILAMQFQGDVRFGAVNTRRRIQFQSNGLTQVAAVAQVAIDDRPFLSASVLGVNASTGLANGRATVDQCLLRRPIGRLADRAIARKTPEVESNLSQEVSSQARTKLEAQLGEMIGKANSSILNDLLPRARRLDLTPRVSASSAAEEIRLRLTEDVECGLAAPAPPAASATGSGTVALHQSLATDLVNRLYVRRKLPRKVDLNTFQRLNDALIGVLPDGPFRDAEIRDRDDVKLALDLNFPRPFDVAFDAGKFAITLHAQEVELGEGSPLPAHDVTVEYRVTLQPDGLIRFEREGAPRIVAREPGREVSPELTAAVRDELLVNLRQTFSVDTKKLLGALPSSIGLLDLTADRGWLTASVVVRP